MHAITQLSIFAMLASEAWWPVIKNRCYLVCSEENQFDTTLVYYDEICSPPSLPLPLAPKYMYKYVSCTSKIMKGSRDVYMKCTLVDFNCNCQIFSLCPGGKKSPISIGAHKMHWHLGQKGKLKDRYFSWNNCCERIL